MIIKHNIKAALIALKINKFRAGLTILGIVIGIASVTLVMSLGQGAQDLILNQVRGLGAKIIFITPGREPKGPTDFAGELMISSLKEKEVEALKKKANVPHLTKASPVVMETITASYGSRAYRGAAIGGTELLAQIYEIFPEEGALFTEEDVRNRAEVVVIGSKAKEELFGENETLGQRIKIKGRNFRVVGILPKKGPGSLINFDEIMVVPYTTAQQYIFGTKHFQHIIIEVDSEKNVPQTVEDIKITLRNLHNITDPEKDDFYIQTQEDVTNQVGMVSNVLTYFLAAVAGISLLVGGIGVMTIMLVSVTERTSEIGLRKALGATNKNILNQFIAEALLLTMSGGALGIIAGYLLSFLASLFLRRFLEVDWPFVFPLYAALAGFLTATLIGFIFGLYPAHQASLKSPIEALRYE